MRCSVPSVQDPWSQIHTEHPAPLFRLESASRHRCGIWLRDEWPFVSHQDCSVPDVCSFGVVWKGGVESCPVVHLNNTIMLACFRSWRTWTFFRVLVVLITIPIPLSFGVFIGRHILVGCLQVLHTPPFRELPGAEIIKGRVITTEAIRFFKRQAETFLLLSKRMFCRHPGDHAA